MILDSFLLLALVNAIAAPGQVVPSQSDTTESSEIVVTASRQQLQPKPDAVDALQKWCFDPARLTGSPVEPAEGSSWFPLEPDERRQFQIEDPSVAAFSSYDSVRDHELWLKIEQIDRPKERLVEDKCTILVIGGADHRRLIRDMSRLYGGTPTQRHVGHRAGSPILPKWQQWLWTGNPQRGSNSWSSIRQDRRSGPPTWLVVANTQFYRRSDYLYGEVKIADEKGVPSIINFGVIRRNSE